jgi:hypothetical protein
MPSLRCDAAVEDWLAYFPLDGSDHVKTTTVETAERGARPWELVSVSSWTDRTAT